ncbi:MAG: hypothetical protein COB85_04190 [Bacteroidetes bacterium]|nr:MAG: hypothetical protein COB85_04190 [Bacteroidota bacterium]
MKKILQLILLSTLLSSCGTVRYQAVYKVETSGSKNSVVGKSTSLIDAFASAHILSFRPNDTNNDTLLCQGIPYHIFTFWFEPSQSNDTIAINLWYWGMGKKKHYLEALDQLEDSLHATFGDKMNVSIKQDSRKK